MSYLKKQWPILVVLLVITPLGLATKCYSGAGQQWVHDYAGDILYTMFWYFLCILMFPQTRPAFMSLLVFFFSVFVELSQLSDATQLLWLRQFFVGRTLVGVSFSFTDIGYYYLGSQLALFLHLGLHLFFFPAAAAKPKGHHHSL